MVQRLRYSCRAQCRSWNSKKSFSIAITKCEGKANRSNWDCWVSPHSSSQRFMRPPPPEQRTGGRFCFNPASGIHVHLILCGQGRGTATCTPSSFSWQHAQHLFPLSPLLSPPCCWRLICDLRDQSFLPLWVPSQLLWPGNPQLFHI